MSISKCKYFFDSLQLIILLTLHLAHLSIINPPLISKMAIGWSIFSSRIKVQAINACFFFLFDFSPFCCTFTFHKRLTLDIDSLIYLILLHFIFVAFKIVDMSHLLLGLIGNKIFDYIFKNWSKKKATKKSQPRNWFGE